MAERRHVNPAAVAALRDRSLPAPLRERAFRHVLVALWTAPAAPEGRAERAAA
jgi:hypothetical protein